MSLLKRNNNGNKSSGKSKDNHEASSSSNNPLSSLLLEPPPSPSSRLFRKSASIEYASDVERPQSQQSQRSSAGGGGGGNNKKSKKLPGFLSKVFGGGNSSAASADRNSACLDAQVESSYPSRAAGVTAVPNAGDRVKGNGRSTSHESVNSVMSSSSFSFVNPTNINGGKRAKGKRIPVDDPDYGRTSKSNGGDASGESGKAVSEDGKRSGGLSSTLDKIGVKIGLKKKYNLQSCESLQYIDACEEPYLPAPPPPPTAAPAQKSPTKSTTATVTVVSSSPLPVPQAAAVDSSMGQRETRSSFFSSSTSNAPAEMIPPKTEIATSATTASISQLPKNSPKIYEVIKRPSTSDASPLPKTKPVEMIVQSYNKESDIKKTFSENSAQTIPPPIPVPTVITPLTKKNVQETAPITPTTTETTHNKPISTPPINTTTALSEPTAPPSLPKTPPPQEEEEPQPSTSAAAYSGAISPIPPAIASCSSNTWSNSGRRKRRAPPPPSKNKFANGVSPSCAETSISVVSDTSNDVPSSSSQAALLKKFTRIEQSPPPPPKHTAVLGGRPSYGGGTGSSGTFEIRPRKKERSVEPPMMLGPYITSRPTSSFASSSPSGKSNTLFSHRHKRSNSEGQGSSSCSVYNTNTRGRVHKPGKKKAPPPPNPFGDPDASVDEAEAEEEESAAVVVDALTTKSTENGVQTQLAGPSSSLPLVESLPPTAPPKLHKKQTSTPLPPATTISINPFDEEVETPANSSIMVNSQVALEQTNPQQRSLDISADNTALELEEIRQNALNEQQERQQILGGSQEDPPESGSNNTGRVANLNSTTTTTAVESGSRITIISTVPSTVSSTSTSSTITATPTMITETDLQSAERALEVLSASIATTSTATSNSGATPSVSTGTVVAGSSENKIKLLELKKEAERSPLNASPRNANRNSRPISIGSSIIYESPLAMLLGKVTSSSNGNHRTSGESSGESSPKVKPKQPWYKQLTPKIKPHSNTAPIKPFTSLVKFSELDKEAGRIVEENRRKLEEQRMLETEQELMELFSAVGMEDQEVPPQGNTVASPLPIETPSTSTIEVTPPTTIPSTASSSTIVTATAQIHQPTNVVEEDEISNAEDREQQTSPNTSRTQDNGSPTFQSVHAASKHRKVIKPLLTSSPITNMRSEKLAIVQPQTQGKSASSTIATSSSTSNPMESTLSETRPPTTVRTTTEPIPTSNSNPIPLPSSTTTSVPSIMNSRTTTTVSTTTTTTTTTSAPAEWDCPRCTLKNPSWRILCEICFQRKDPPSSISNSFMSSILQRVNAESLSNKSTPSTPPTPPTSSSQNSTSFTSIAKNVPTTVPATTPANPNPATSISTSIPSVVEDLVASSSSSTTTTTSSSLFNDKHKLPLKKDIPQYVQCENFLSQLPASSKKDDLLAKKEDKLVGMMSKLQQQEHEDPELEELDIGKLRKARLAYFQKHQPKTSSSLEQDDEQNQENDDDDSTEKPVNRVTTTGKNNLDSSSSRNNSNYTVSSRCSETNEQKQQLLPETTSKKSFADNEDDFLDHIIQLDDKAAAAADVEIPTTVENISNAAIAAAQSLKPGISLPNDVASCSQIRYRPRLECIREGNSQDYTYCYSSSEIAKIYENWQASSNCNNSQQQSQTQKISTTPSLVHHHHHQHPISSYLLNTNGILTTTTTHSPVLPSTLLLAADHQPYANNRLSADDNNGYEDIDKYMNVVGNNGRAVLPPPPTPLLFRAETAAFSNNLRTTCSPTPPPPLWNISCGESNNSNNFNYENTNMSFNGGASSSNGGGGGGGRRLTYEDYRRMGAIPKGFPMNSGEWSTSESSSSDSGGGRGGVMLPPFFGGFPGADNCSPGITRRGTLEAAPSCPLNFSEGYPGGDHHQSMAVSKLMKRLEAAIAQGDHRLAATLAHDMALMKANCVAVKINQPFSIRVYVEDRFMQQGPFLVQVSSMMSVKELKMKIERDWGIPSGFQKWILGRQMAEEENQSLSMFEIAQDSMAFLFLVTPDMGGGASVSNPSASATPVVTDLTKRNITGSDNQAANIPNVAPINFAKMQQRSNKLSGDGSSTESLEPKQSPVTAKKRVSSMAQTTTITPTGSLGKQKNVNKKEASPPPLPSKSPVPPPNSKTKSECTEGAAKMPIVGRSSSSPHKVIKLPPQQPNAVNSSSTAINSETLSAASALTLSLQQKLSEFKAVAEQTFGNNNFAALPPKQLRKEKSPASPSTASASSSKKIINTNHTSTGRNHDSSPVRKTDETGTPSAKPPVRKNAKSQSTASSNSSSKEKLAGSKEKLSSAANADSAVPENRFNGILLQTPTSSESVKPPERLDKTNKKSINSSSGVESDENTISKGEGKPTGKTIEKTEEKESFVSRKEGEEIPAAAIFTTSDTAKPSSPPPPRKRDVISPIKKTEEHPSTPSPVPNEAPQPKPRGIKKQQSNASSTSSGAPTTAVEKVSQGTESPTVIVSTSNLPKPLPRTLPANIPAIPQPSDLGGATAIMTVTQAQSNKEFSPPLLDKSSVEGAAGGEAEVVDTLPQSFQLQQHEELKVDDFCQTTLPFPPAKYRATTSPSTSSAGTGNLLLRPSAFVTQLKSSNNDGGTTATSTIVAHVQPFQKSSTPTAFVSPQPSPSTSVAPPPPNNDTRPPPQEQVEEKKNDSKKEVLSAQHEEPPAVSNTSTSSDAAATSYLKMLELMEKQDLICSGEDTECPVCFSAVPRGEGVVLRDCLHVFCRECLIGCVEYADDSTVKCPYRDNDYACNYNLQEREIKALVPSDVFEKYLARSVKLAESKIVNTFHCKTPDCSGWCVFEDDVNIFLCPVCKKRNCLTCAAIHDGMDCQKYQRELAIAAETDEDAKQSRLMLEKMIQRGEALDCPQCSVVLLKKWGCDWVRCSYCKTEICWVTKGFRWGPEGKGDVSGGCKCGVNGVKCHPKCTYCH